MGTSASFALARKFAACLLAALLSFTLLPASALAQGEAEQPQDAVDSQAGEPQEVGSDQADEAAPAVPTLASGLVGSPTAFINSDVALDSEPIIGSFTVDGLTFAVTEGSDVELVGVSPDWQRVMSSQEGEDSPVAPMLASGSDGSTLSVPESVTYDGTDYAVASIGAYAFYLSGVTDVELPASVTQVDDRAFRSSDVASVTVADGNPTYSSFDGALYDADQSSLLLIPEGKQGTVLLPKRAEVADAGKFSHCSLASAIAVEEGSAAFASENGLLYNSDLTTLLRVPAGATDIVIRDGCTTIAAGALEACASLATITAPASVTSISPDMFTSVPTVSLPAVLAVADDPGASTGATDGSSEQAGSTPASSSTTTQLTAMVALSSTDDDLPEVDPAAILLRLLEGADARSWQALGFMVSEGVGPILPELEGAITYAAGVSLTVNMNGGTIMLRSVTPNRAVESYTWTSIREWAANAYGIGVTDYSTGAYSNVATGISRPGYAFKGWSFDRNATSGSSYQSQGYTASIYAIWAKQPIYSLSLDDQGGQGGLGCIYQWTGKGFYGVAAPSDSTASLSVVPVPVRPGYAFGGYAASADGNPCIDSSGNILVGNTAFSASTTLVAQWSLAISADVPLEVTAWVDLLGLEDQEEAQGYIESRCGEPLTVAEVAFEPLAGATEFFGAASVADVALEVLAAGSTSPDARFTLDASASQAPASSAAFRMASYGTRVPISYRFAIPDALLSTLAEATRPVCSVAYTVALA